jgi:membrane protease YdiL (CAAX protease family)
MKAIWNALRNFLVREDPEHDEFEARYQARTLYQKVFYIFMLLAPGVFAFVILNVSSVYFSLLDLTGWSGPVFQGIGMFFITYVWHMVMPLLMLRYVDGLKFRESLAFLGFTKFDKRGMFLVLPIVFVIFSFITLPYLQWIAMPIREWTRSIEFLAMPEYSIFLGGEGGLYSFPLTALIPLLIGNFVGEELYYRGYLMKKTAFLGRWNWSVSGFLFGIYHFWQAEQTWPLAIPAMIFTLMMVWRKDIYVVIILHALLNIVFPWFRVAMGVNY